MIYGDRSGFIKPYPLKERRLVFTTVSRLHRDVGFPARMTTDSAKEFVKGKFGPEVRKTGTTLSHIEPHTPRLNYIEMLPLLLVRRSLAPFYHCRCARRFFFAVSTSF